MTIAHTGIKTPAARHAEVVAWYEAALAPLGYKRMMEYAGGLVAGFGDASGIDWWITSSEATPPGVPVTGDGKGEGILPVHTAFKAADRDAVVAFHQAALVAGGKCNGEPGVRAHYGPTYYAAFVLDPVGNNIEAVYTADGH
ncbi:hypothetical protein C8A05DRAFT_20120 [Staphylotrichum tortipilum]|uniref:Glyoxalase n=1 Tax=Staphylotrichum tortipilum TaxID=2831512 RepID=A0AAN6RND1_9PEZI|nr:hypothetical protein C8A05DRAFT_20120 [Staphylotrichum longicolle]